jgi:hypothetical protein
MQVTAAEKMPVVCSRLYLLLELVGDDHHLYMRVDIEIDALSWGSELADRSLGLVNAALSDQPPTSDEVNTVRREENETIDKTYGDSGASSVARMIGAGQIHCREKGIRYPHCVVFFIKPVKTPVENSPPITQHMLIHEVMYAGMC